MRKKLGPVHCRWHQNGTLAITVVINVLTTERTNAKYYREQQNCLSWLVLGGGSPESKIWWKHAFLRAPFFYKDFSHRSQISERQTARIRAFPFLADTHFSSCRNCGLICEPWFPLWGWPWSLAAPPTATIMLPQDGRSSSGPHPAGKVHTSFKL